MIIKVYNYMWKDYHSKVLPLSLSFVTDVKVILILIMFVFLYNEHLLCSIRLTRGCIIANLLPSLLALIHDMLNFEGRFTHPILLYLPYYLRVINCTLFKCSLFLNESIDWLNAGGAPMVDSNLDYHVRILARHVLVVFLLGTLIGTENPYTIV